MEQALFHIQAAIEVLRRSAGPRPVISTLEGAQASLMHDIFGASLAPARDYVMADLAEGRLDPRSRRAATPRRIWHGERYDRLR
jgi:hypothetical protein